MIQKQNDAVHSSIQFTLFFNDTATTETMIMLGKVFAWEPDPDLASHFFLYKKEAPNSRIRIPYGICIFTDLGPGIGKQDAFATKVTEEPKSEPVKIVVAEEEGGPTEEELAELKKKAGMLPTEPGKKRGPKPKDQPVEA